MKIGQKGKWAQEFSGRYNEPKVKNGEIANIKIGL